MPNQPDGATQVILARLLEENNLTGESLLYREAERRSLTPAETPGAYRLIANAHPSESVIDVYGPGYVVQAEQVGPGLAFAESARPNWQETMELRALQAAQDAAADRLEVEVRLQDILGQGGLIYPVVSVTVEKAWYVTLPHGGVDVREAT